MSSGQRPLAPDSLAYALLHAARACAEVRRGHALTEALIAQRGQLATPAARGAVQDIAYRTMRRRGTADALIDAFCQQPPRPPLLRELLAAALTLLDAGDEAPGSTRYADFTVVDQAVAAAAHEPSLIATRAVVNAVLRNVLRETERVRAILAADEAARLNYPAWWIARVRAAYPESWQEVLDAGQHAAPLTLRVNQRRTTVADYLELLAQSGQPGVAIGAHAVRLERARPVNEIPGFVEGLASVQDEGAQRAAPLCDLADGQRVLDACAAPGGKTAHMLELARVDVTALDISAQRLQRVTENLQRLGLSARLCAGDVCAPETWWDGRLFERILADVPCTASGIVRRHPDIRWLRRESDIGSLSRQQQQILDALWRLLAPGGKLVLVTCSVFPEEAEGLARDFAARHADSLRAQAPGQLLPRADRDADHDGLFFALFHKSA